MTDDQYFAELMAFARPEDHAMLAGLRGAYVALWRIAQQYKPRTVIEIGVRCGYSALTFGMANPPDVHILGIEGDIDEVTRGCWLEAERKLRGEYIDIRVIVANSHDIRRLPQADLVYVDGDHSVDGCHADLLLACQSTSRILVDDYFVENPIATAVWRFVAEHPEWQATVIPYSEISGYVLLERE